MPERHVAARGTRFFLDVRGAETNPPLLYVHGGPGMSCYEFMTWQGDRLSQSLHVIGMDQRGVLRSDPLGDGETFTEDTLADDCEAVREALGIPQWTVLGHSFGGRVALRYATRYPERVAAAIFECPGWDFDETEQQRLPAAAAIFDELGDDENARRCRELAASPPESTWETLEVVVQLVVHDRYDDLYFYQPRAREAWRASQRSSLPAELRARSQRHQNVAIPLMAESLLPLLAKLTVPATLIVADHDLVTGPRQVAAFERLVPHGTVVRFPNSSHFPQLEEARAYAELVVGTVTGLA